MADPIVSAVAERIIAIIEEQTRYHVNLVRGIKKEAKNLSRELKTIRNMLNDAERRRFRDESVKDWLKRLEDTSYEMDDVLDEWNIAILKLRMEHESNNAVVAPPKHKVCPSILSSCLCFKKVVVHHDIAKKILNVKEQLDQILAEKDRYNFVMSQPTADPSPKSWRVQSTSSIDLAEVHGRDPDREIVMSKLRPKGSSQEELSLHILSIVGMGGVGKTTLAQLVYNDNRVREYFESRIWICVSDPFDVVGITKGIIESMRKGSCPDTNQLEMLLQYLRDSISKKRFLLVLDDVWTEDYTKWEPLKNSLKCGGVGSKILVTTRNERVAKIMGTMDNDIHNLGQLTQEDCWLLLRRIALFGRKEEEFEKFRDFGKKIANKCKGLPLAAKVLGSLLRFKNSLEEWENVLNNEIWQLEEAEVELFPHLLLSYNELSPALKHCFSYCAVFAKDSVINVERLITKWMALGYLSSNIGNGGDMELIGREYFQNLAMRSLFQDFEKDGLDGKIKGCKMHDIVHDFAQYLRKDRSNGRVEASCQSCSPSLVSHVKKYRSLFCYKEPPPNICDCLTSLRVLGITNCYLHSIPQGVENLIHLRWLHLSENKLSWEDTKAICKLYNLQFLWLSSCYLEGIPEEIGCLIHLRHLDLSRNAFLKKLPESICGLHELRILNVDSCTNLRELPEGICRLINLKHLHNEYPYSRNQFPQGLAKLTGLRTLTEFHGGSGRNKLGLLKNLNHLSGSLKLIIRLADDDLEDVVEDAREADLKKKEYIQQLEIRFQDVVKKNESSVMMDVIDALEPHPNLRNLKICHYKGSKLPGWIASPLNLLRYIILINFYQLSSLPALGKLPCLEEIYIWIMDELQFVGREFLGITTTIGGDMDIQSPSSSMAAATNTIGFPKLKKLTFSSCHKWKEWEDITAEEEDSAAVSLMPCLTELTISDCEGLTALPERLLREASSLEKLDISGSYQLQRRYRDKDGSAWKSISSQNPGLQLKLW